MGEELHKVRGKYCTENKMKEEGDGHIKGIREEVEGKSTKCGLCVFRL